MAAVAENGIGSDDQFMRRSPQPIANGSSSSETETEYQRDVRKLVDLLSKLNPSAKEFFPSSYPALAPAAAAATPRNSNGRLSADAPVFIASTDYYNNIYSNQSSNKDSSSDGSGNHQFNRRVRTSLGFYGFSCFHVLALNLG